MSEGPAYRFARVSVRGSRWRTRFDRILKRAARVVVLSRDLPDDAALLFEYANRVVAGLAILLFLSLLGRVHGPRRGRVEGQSG